MALKQGTKRIDAIIIGQSEIVRYEDYSRFPIDRIHLYKDLVFLRMVHLNGQFMSHLDVINLVRSGKTFAQASSDKERRKLLSIWNMPGLSSLLVASAAHHEGFNVKIINNFDSEFDRFLEYYDSQPVPPLVGISTTFYLGYSEVKRLTKKLRRHDPKMKILIGGAFANEQTINSDIQGFEGPMRKYGVDYVLHSFNSDEDFPALLRAHQQGDGFQQVSNLAYFSAGEFCTTPKLWRNPTLNSRPMLWKEVDLSFVNRTVQLRAASGCPFSCAFCSYPDTAGGHFSMELALIENQLRDIQSLGYVDRIVFIDDTFNVPIRRFKEILKIICKFEFEWFSFLRVQYIDEEVARLMKQSGCRGVYLGIESANDTVLKNMNKKVSREKFLKGMAHLKKYEITTFAAFVIGFPGETLATIDENIAFLNDFGVDFYSTKEFFYMAHTGIHAERAKYGLTGMGSEWSHSTMDSKTAAEMKTYMFRNVKEAIFLDPDTSLWYLAYLYDQGFTFDQIKSCQRIMNDMMLDEINGRFDGKEPHLARLADVLADGGSNIQLGRQRQVIEVAST
jgi:p-methyltransferase